MNEFHISASGFDFEKRGVVMNTAKTKSRSIILVCFFLIALFSTVGYAENAEIIGSMSNGSIYRVDGSCMNPLFRDGIVSLGISVTDNTLVEVVPANRMTDAGSIVGLSTALVITNRTGDSVVKDVVIMVDSYGDIRSVPVTSLAHAGAATMSSSSATFPPTSWDGRYVITARAVYDNPLGEYYRPRKVEFSYVKYETCTVNSIRVQYICDGFAYTYPGYTSLGDDEIEWVISKQASSPTAGTTYSTTRAYSSSKVIYTGSGSPSVGQFLTFTPKVDNQQTSYTVRLQ